MKELNVVKIFFYAVILIVGLYPLLYILGYMSGGLLATKPAEVLNDQIWVLLFYVHISAGGIALISGSTQLNKKIREKYIGIHRVMGKTYVLSVVCSGLAGFYLALFASDGLIAKVGFGMLSIFWVTTSLIAHAAIIKRKVQSHQFWMIRSYALSTAAITLRIWLPVMVGLANLPFIGTYRYIAWICWVPNLIVAEIFITKLKK